MHLIDSAGSVTTMPSVAAAGAPGYFQDESLEDGQPGTVADQDWFNMVQVELKNILAAAGVSPVKGAFNQVITAIQILIAEATADLAIAAADTGGVNAVVVETSPSFTTRSYGRLIAFSPADTNTGAATINENGLGAVPIERGNGSAVQAGDLVAVQPALAWWDGAAYRLMSLSASQATAIASALAASAESAAETYAAAQAAAAQAAATSAAEAYAASITPTYGGTATQWWEKRPDGKIRLDGYVTGSFAGDASYTVNLPSGGGAPTFTNFLGGHVTSINTAASSAAQGWGQVQTAPGALSAQQVEIFLNQQGGGGPTAVNGYSYTLWFD